MVKNYNIMQSKKINFEKVILYSVGGDIEERKERAWFFDQCGKHSKNIYNGALYVSGRTWSLVPKLETTFSSQKCYCNFDEDEYPTILFRPVPGYKNVVLNIGHSDPKTFTDLMVRNQKHIHFLLIQGPGFNFMDFYPGGFPNWLKLRDVFGKEKALGGPGKLMGTCFPHPGFKQQLAPFYTATQWNELFKYYPVLLQNQRITTLVKFWLTRSGGKLLKLNGDDGGKKVMTGAFYRQFLLNELVRQNKYLDLELAVINHVKMVSGNICDSLLKELLKIKKDFNTENKKIDINEYHEKVFEKIYEAYGKWKIEIYDKLSESKKNKMNHFFYKGILLNIESIYFKTTKKEFQIKEYDGFSAHILARTMTGLKDNLSPELHYQLMIHVLSNGEKGRLPDGYIDRLKGTLSDIVIHVFHDLGLDPQADDYIAIKIIEFLTN